MMQAVTRTAVAILCGFLAMMIIVIAGTVAATTLFVAGGLGTMNTPDTPLSGTYLTANLLVSFLGALAGGWLASRLDTPGSWRAVIGTAALVLAMSVTNRFVPRGSSGEPLAWYPWIIVAIGVAGTMLGGWLRLRGRPRSA